MKKIVYEDLYMFRFLSEVKLSPDSEYTIFIENKADKEDNQYKSSLWLNHLKTGENTLLASDGGIKSAVWLDGRNILFVADREKDKENQRTDVYQLSLDGGEARLFMKIPAKASGIVPLSETLFLVTVYCDELQEKDDDFFIADELPFWFNGKGIVNKKRVALYIGRKDGLDCRLSRMTPELTDVQSVAVSPDKKQIAYSGKTFKDLTEMRSDLWLYTIADQGSQLLQKGAGEIGDLCFMENETLFYTLQTYEWAGRSPHFYTMDITHKKVEEWPFYDKVIQNSVGSDARYGGGKSIAWADGKLYYLEANECDTYVAVLDAQGKRTYLNQVEGAVNGFDVANGKFVMAAMRGQQLTEIYSVDLNDGKESQLTNFNGSYFSEHQVSAPECFSYDSRNGYSMKGFVVKPIDYVAGKKYPAVLSMHGGPKVVFGSVFHHEMQCLAAEGYFVIYTNPRGSDGRGEAFADLTRNLGGPDFDDFMEFVDEAAARHGDIDEAHMGICGGSYGGFMCNWMIGHTHRFAAAVSQRSISNYTTKLLCTDIGFYHNQLQIGTYPWEDFDLLWEHSPLKMAEHATTPTLFLQSDEDYRCYMSDAMQMFSALKRHGCETRMVLFHGENHELSRSGKPHNRITRLAEMGQWFDKYLK